MEPQITELLRRVRNGDSFASEELMPLVYAELHRIARQRLRNERRNHTLQPTALVNEAYLRMFQHAPPEITGRAHFLAFASRVMRQILVDHARGRGARKRGGPEHRAPGATIDMAMEGASHLVELLDLDRAIAALTRDNPLPAQVIEMRYFGGMTAEETAEVVGRSVHVVQHELRFAHAWLRRKLTGAGASSGSPT
jgi:RNA polymerase sigma-70 factor (ECF subfamily)